MACYYDDYCCDIPDPIGNDSAPEGAFVCYPCIPRSRPHSGMKPQGHHERRNNDHKSHDQDRRYGDDNNHDRKNDHEKHRSYEPKPESRNGCCKPVQTKYVMPCYRYEDGRIENQPTVLMTRACEVAVGKRERRKPFVCSTYRADPDKIIQKYVSEDEKGKPRYDSERERPSHYPDKDRNEPPMVIKLVRPREPCYECHPPSPCPPCHVYHPQTNNTNQIPEWPRTTPTPKKTDDSPRPSKFFDPGPQWPPCLPSAKLRAIHGCNFDGFCGFC